MAIEDQIVSLDPSKSGWAIKLLLRNPNTKQVSCSKWLDVPADWICDEIVRSATDRRLLERQAIADAGAQAKPKEVSDE